jgi:hypothetical protein
MPTTAMDFDFTDTMPSELDLAVMVLTFVVERPAMGTITPMPTAIVGNHVPVAVPATAPRVIAVATTFFSNTQGAEAQGQN